MTQKIRGKITFIEYAILGYTDGIAQDMKEFPHVAWPIMFQRRRQTWTLVHGWAEPSDVDGGR